MSGDIKAAMIMTLLNIEMGKRINRNYQITHFLIESNYNQ